ncbi:MAG: TonB C-terminal domain-containing protein [Thermoanaerobaculaceae bacterium]|nr:TonB C-terminal domain-containing protein [Thermoanaerobaculaceae bacterium]
MIDPVSEVLQQRRDEPVRWAKPVAAALLLHLLIAAGALLTPRPRHRPLLLPSIRVHAAMPLAPAGPPAPAAEPARPKTAATPAGATPTAKRAVASERTKPKRPTPSTTDRTEKTAPGSPAPAPAGAAARGGSPTGVAAVGAGPVDDPRAFPYQYYLDRLVTLVESNWFRPAAPPGTSCRVRCRISRSGKLLEAGVETTSGNPSFDRAALRALYAGAPFPPLPEAYGGNELTIHLEFGP